MKAVVMAGGEGTRLRPLTCKLPKPMVPILDKPVMEYGLKALSQLNIKDAAVTLQYLPEAITGYFGDGADYGLNLHYFIEQTPLGTAGSVKHAAPVLDETFLVISGDALSDFPLEDAIAFHRAKGAVATLVLTRVAAPLEYGLVLTGADGRIERFLEKPSWGQVFSDTVNTGIYILEPQVLDLVPNDTPFDFSRDLFPKLLAQKAPLYGYVYDGYYWCDVGTLEQYRQVHYDILDGKVQLDIDAEWNGKILMGKDCRISSRARIEGPVYLGPECSVGAGAHVLPYSVIGRGAVVEPAASLKRSILWPGVYVGGMAEIRGAVIGRGAVVGRVSSVYEGAVIGDQSVLSSQVTIRPEVKIWPEKRIETGSIIGESVVWSERTARRLFTKDGIRGTLWQDLTPERLARIGRTAASELPPGTRIAVGRDGSGSAAAGQHALVAGLSAAGAEVVQTGRLTLPAFRFAVRELETPRGCFLGMGEDGKSISLRILDTTGRDLTKNEERKIENLFHREEFRLVAPEQLREPVLVPDMITAYLQWLTRQIDLRIVRGCEFKVVIGARTVHESNFMAMLLDKIGVSFLRTDSVQRLPLPEIFDRETVFAAVRRAVDRENVTLGIIAEAGSGQISLIGPNGQTIEKDDMTMLLLNLFAERFRQAFLKVHLPVGLEQYFSARGLSVQRSRSAEGEYMLDLIQAGEFEQMALLTDGLFAAVKLLELMGRNAWRFEDLAGTCPKVCVSSRDVAVPWEMKGNVIRRLAAEYGVRTPGAALEGVRMNAEDGFALVLPDEDNPTCRLYAESFNLETAESINDLIEAKIRQLCQE